MISFKINYKKLFVGLMTLVLFSCSNPWDDRENNGDSNLSVNLSEAISDNSDLTQFGQLLVQTGYDKILAASKTYTVFVPTNEAMEEVNSTILNDEEALKQFVANHIALTAYSSIRTSDVRIKMLSGKYLDFTGTTSIDDATIITADQYAANGVYHIIDKVLTPKLNIWEYVNSQAGNSAMSDYLLSLKDFSIYSSDETAKELSETNGAGYLADSLTNSYLKNVYNLNNEKNLYTLFLIKDTGYSTEVDKMKPYLIKTSNDSERDSTAIYSSYFTVRDLAFGKKLERADLPDLPATLTSKFGVEVPVDKTKIVEEIHLSNGIVYIMDNVEVPLENRLLTTKIEGEKNSGYLVSRSKIFYRDNVDPLGVTFNDIYVYDPTIAYCMLQYNAKDLYSTTYKVYWRAVNDFQTNVFQQRLIVGNVIDENNTFYPTQSIKDFGYVDVPLLNYEEVYLGDFTLDEAGNIDLISLVGQSTTTKANNSLTLDYLKFVPVIK